ncbi:MAG: (2Fe-2S)-binding protein [Bradyrhizobiaceae bacterium]|nr:(2Fe-2S)-binding protein [Bradyrhizobiaceae bacterium]
MIVCSCNVISDQQVRTVTAEHAVRGTSEVYRCLGCSAACGRCVRTIRDIIDEVNGGIDPASPGIAALPERFPLARERRKRERHEQPESGIALAAAS